MKQEVIHTIEDLSRVAREALSFCVEGGAARIITLQGDLGAGKTAFVKELGKLLHVEYAITSPTFAIMKSYPVHGHSFLRTLTHIDAYRIESDDEMRVLGFDEIKEDVARLICIEWPEKMEAHIPKDALPVTLKLLPDGSREISYGR